MSSNGRWRMQGAIVGFGIGLSLTLLAHRSEPFESAPLIFLALLVAALGGLISLSLLVFRKKPHPIVVCAFSCFATMLAVLVVVPLIWPYPQSAPPKPLSSVVDQREMTG